MKSVPPQKNRSVKTPLLHLGKSLPCTAFREAVPPDGGEAGMARISDLRKMIEQFTTQLEEVVSRKAHEAFASRFDTLKSQLLGAPAVSRAASRAAPTRGRRG